MKTKTTQFTAYGNLAIVQFSVEPETTFLFKPAVPELKTGGLIISEATGSGIVGTLIAVNNTESFLLLTDADVLTGAKQNRVLNKSVLLKPMSKTSLDVSCVERRRWHYTSGHFDNSRNVADPDLRREKASSSASGLRANGFELNDTQMRVWSHVRHKMSEVNFESNTESYSDLLDHRMSRMRSEFPACDPAEASNGLAVFIDSKVLCADIFGNNEVYRYYFPMLRDSAFRMANTDKKQKAPDMHEAYYRVQEVVESFLKAEMYPDESYTGEGSFKTVENKSLTGFDLSVKEEVIHGVLFAK